MSRSVKFQIYSADNSAAAAAGPSSTSTSSFIHRVRFDTSYPSRAVILQRFAQILSSHHPDLLSDDAAEWTFHYVDDEQDECLISNQEELNEAFSVYDDTSKPLKLIVRSRKSAATAAATTTATASASQQEEQVKTESASTDEAKSKLLDSLPSVAAVDSKQATTANAASPDSADPGQQTRKQDSRSYSISSDVEEFVHVKNDHDDNNDSSSSSSSSSSEIEFEPNSKEETSADVAVAAAAAAPENVFIKSPASATSVRSKVTVEDAQDDEDLNESKLLKSSLPKTSDVILEKVPEQTSNAATSSAVSVPEADKTVKDQVDASAAVTSSLPKVSTSQDNSDEKSSQPSASDASQINAVNQFIKLFSELDKKKPEAKPHAAIVSAPSSQPLYQRSPAPYSHCGSGTSSSIAAPTTTATASTAAVNNHSHAGIECDGCGQYPLIGIRYKCSECSNYDLCAGCVEKGVTSEDHHQDHILLRFAKPTRSSAGVCPAMNRANRHGNYHGSRHGNYHGNFGPNHPGHPGARRCERNGPSSKTPAQDGTYVFDLSDLLGGLGGAAAAASANAFGPTGSDQQHRHAAKLNKIKHKYEESQRKFNEMYGNKAAPSTSDSTSNTTSSHVRSDNNSSSSNSANSSSQQQQQHQPATTTSTSTTAAAATVNGGQDTVGHNIVNSILGQLSNMGLLQASNPNASFYTDLINNHKGDVSKIVNDILKITR